MRRCVAVAAPCALLALAGSANLAQAAMFLGIDLHDSDTTPLPVHQRVNSTQAWNDFSAQLLSYNVISFEPEEGYTAHPHFPYQPGGVGLDPEFNAGGVSGRVNSAVIRHQPEGTAGPPHDPRGRYPSHGVHYIGAIITDSIPHMTIEFDEPQEVFGIWGIDVGDFGGDLLITLVGDDDNRHFVVPAISDSAEFSGSILFFGFAELGFEFSTVLIGNSDPEDIFAFDELTVGRIIPAPGAGATLALASFAGLRRRRRSG